MLAFLDEALRFFALKFDFFEGVILPHGFITFFELLNAFEFILLFILQKISIEEKCDDIYLAFPDR
jgi:hypothetical protein